MSSRDLFVLVRWVVGVRDGAPISSFRTPPPLLTLEHPSPFQSKPACYNPHPPLLRSSSRTHHLLCQRLCVCVTVRKPLTPCHPKPDSLLFGFSSLIMAPVSSTLGVASLLSLSPAQTCWTSVPFPKPCSYSPNVCTSVSSSCINSSPSVNLVIAMISIHPSTSAAAFLLRLLARPASVLVRQSTRAAELLFHPSSHSASIRLLPSAHYVGDVWALFNASHQPDFSDLPFLPVLLLVCSSSTTSTDHHVLIYRCPVDSSSGTVPIGALDAVCLPCPLPSPRALHPFPCHCFCLSTCTPSRSDPACRNSSSSGFFLPHQHPACLLRIHHGSRRSRGPR